MSSSIRTPSIRTFLLINLLLSVTLITSVAIIGNLFLEHKDIQTQADSELHRNAMQIQAFFSDGLTNRQFNIVQHNIEAAMNPDSFLTGKLAAEDKRVLSKKKEHISFQIWDKNGKLILHSKGAPKIPFSSGKLGLSTVWRNNQSWRVETTYNPTNQLTVVVAEQSNFRQELENQLTQDSIFIMLITYPFLGLLIWIIVGRGLETVKKVANEVAHRASTYLESVDVDAIPAEIEPLVSELNSLFGRLREAFDREKRFAADAAHELRTPLAAVSTQTQVALRSESEADRRAALENILVAVKRSTHVVQQLLTLSRMVPEATINEPEIIDLVKLAVDVSAQLAPQALEKDIDLEFKAPDESLNIKAISTAISILIRNLVDNAIRYTPAGGNVTIAASKHKNNKVLLTVSDTGPGIPLELRERVFERFFRVIGNKATGSGLGLNIVGQIIKLHDAEITLDGSKTGTGLIVKVLFNKVEADL